MIDKIIYLISIDNCNNCKNMKNAIITAINDSLLGIKLEEIDSETEKAIKISLDNGIDDLPACIIGNYIFCGNNGYSYCKIIDAIEKTWKIKK